MCVMQRFIHSASHGTLVSGPAAVTQQKIMASVDCGGLASEYKALRKLYRDRERLLALGVLQDVEAS